MRCGEERSRRNARGNEGFGVPENAINPIEQFNINRILPFHLFGLDASFTNASLLMLINLALVSPLR